MRGVAQFERNREIQPTRASPKNCRTHAPAPFALTDPACRRTRYITNIKYLDLKLFGRTLRTRLFPRHQWLTDLVPLTAVKVRGISMRRFLPDAALLHQGHLLVDHIALVVGVLRRDLLEIAVLRINRLFVNDLREFRPHVLHPVGDLRG